MIVDIFPAQKYYRLSDSPFPFCLRASHLAITDGYRIVLRNLLSLLTVATGELLTQRFAVSVLPACFALAGHGRLSHGWFVMLSLPYGRDSITTASQLTVLGNMSTPTHFSILYPAASITFRSRTNDVGLQDIYTILLAPNSSIFGNAFG